MTEPPSASSFREWCSRSWARHCGKDIAVCARNSRLSVRSLAPTAAPPRRRRGFPIGMVRTVRLGALLAVPMLVGLRLAPGGCLPLGAPALLFAALAGVALNIPFAVLVKLGQDYLPTRPGTAAGAHRAVRGAAGRPGTGAGPERAGGAEPAAALQAIRPALYRSV